MSHFHFPLCAALLLVAASPHAAEAQAPSASRPRHLTTALRASALLVREGEVLASDERHLLQRVQLSEARPATSSFSPATYPRRILPLDDGGLLIAEQLGQTLHRVYLDGKSEALLSGQRVLNLARDATHVYWLNAGAPFIRRMLLPQDKKQPPAPAKPESVASIPDEFSELAVEAGELFLADVTTKSVLRLRTGEVPATFASLPSEPSALFLTRDALFAGARDGAVYRIARSDAHVSLLGQLSSGVSALAAEGCFVFAGSSNELVAFEASRGVRVPLVNKVTVSALAARSDRVFYTDSQTSGLYELKVPTCPAPTASSEAREVKAAPAATAPKPAAPENDEDPLALRAPGEAHTVLVTLAVSDDALAKESLRQQVTRVLAEPAGEVWARATDAQITALRKLGFIVAYRDGVDRIRCVDVSKNGSAALRALPPPFFDSGAPGAFLVQLALPTHALPDLQEALSTAGATLLETPEPATLLVAANAASARRIAKLPHVTWIGAYGAREKLLSLAYTFANLPPGCGADPDRPLRALAAWIGRAPQAKLELSAVLFAKSAAWKALVRSTGGRVLSEEGDAEETTVRISIRREALAKVASHPALRTLEPYTQPSVD